MRIGILGAGQLGRMLALAGIPLECEFRFLDPVPNSPASVAGVQTAGDYMDAEAQKRFAEGCDAITWEFENVPVEAARALQKYAPVYPAPEALEAYSYSR